MISIQVLIYNFNDLYLFSSPPSSSSSLSSSSSSSLLLSKRRNWRLLTVQDTDPSYNQIQSISWGSFTCHDLQIRCTYFDIDIPVSWFKHILFITRQDKRIGYTLFFKTCYLLYCLMKLSLMHHVYHGCYVLVLNRTQRLQLWNPPIPPYQTWAVNTNPIHFHSWYPFMHPPITAYTHQITSYSQYKWHILLHKLQSIFSRKYM